MNKVFITGRIAKDLKLESTKQGTPVCQFSIATNRPVNRDGEKQVDFITCIVWNKQAENLVKYQRKGNMIGIQGQLRVDTYEVNGERKYKTYVLVENIEFLEARKDIPNDEEKEFNKISSKTITQDTIEITDSDLPW
ncbi:MAG: single-stranded DNA-binding protein [Methanobrevibacter sp.]|nr:single-stranded DNA-binding protein [Methanobrevibacter sp.]MBO7712805.1 single-stranded DNA-binding protein [Methanobrevibacter sp.]